MNTTLDGKPAQPAKSEHAAWLTAAGGGEVDRTTLYIGSGIIRATRLDDKSCRTVQRDAEKGRTLLSRPTEEA